MLYGEKSDGPRYCQSGGRIGRHGVACFEQPVGLFTRNGAPRAGNGRADGLPYSGAQGAEPRDRGDRACHPGRKRVFQRLPDAQRRECGQKARLRRDPLQCRVRRDVRRGIRRAFEEKARQGHRRVQHPAGFGAAPCDLGGEAALCPDRQRILRIHFSLCEDRRFSGDVRGDEVSSGPRPPAHRDSFRRDGGSGGGRPAHGGVPAGSARRRHRAERSARGVRGRFQL